MKEMWRDGVSIASIALLLVGFESVVDFGMLIWVLDYQHPTPTAVVSCGTRIWWKSIYCPS